MLCCLSVPTSRMSMDVRHHTRADRQKEHTLTRYPHSHATKGRLGRSQPQCHRKEPHLEGRAQLRYHWRRHLRRSCMVEQPHQGPCEISHFAFRMTHPSQHPYIHSIFLSTLSHRRAQANTTLNLIPPILANTPKPFFNKYLN